MNASQVQAFTTAVVCELIRTQPDIIQRMTDDSEHRKRLEDGLNHLLRLAVLSDLGSAVVCELIRTQPDIIQRMADNSDRPRFEQGIKNLLTMVATTLTTASSESTTAALKALT